MEVFFMSLEKLKCPYCKKLTNRSFSIHPESTNWIRCDNKNCRKQFGYKVNGKIITKKQQVYILITKEITRKIFCWKDYLYIVLFVDNKSLKV